ncbi:MAG: hypothetical protein IH607_06635, partial [Firmicutes bacterium]|nr:hypothetical protein [Bacillota bacterium]
HVTARHLGHYGLERFAGMFDELLLRSLHALPLLVCEGGFVCALCDESPKDAQDKIEDTYDIHIKVVYFTRLAILRGLDIMFSKTNTPVDHNTPANRLYEAGKINCEQLILVRNYTYKTGRTETWVLREMGLIPERRKAKVVYSGLTPQR